MEWTGEFVRWIDEPGPELPSATTGSPEAAFTATWQNTERPAMKIPAKLLPIITLVAALAALAFSLAAFFTRPNARYLELDNVIEARRSQLEQEFSWLEPEDQTQVKWLIWSIKKFIKWKSERQEFAQAYRAYGALTSEIRRAEADVFDAAQTMRDRKRELEYKAVAAQAIKPPAPNSQIITSVDEVIQLAHTLNEIGWDKDVNLAALLEERAKHEETANPDDARKLRELSQDLAKTMHTPPQSTATSST